jgi:hypothetical protein
MTRPSSRKRVRAGQRVSVYRMASASQPAGGTWPSSILSQTFIAFTSDSDFACCPLPIDGRPTTDSGLDGIEFGDAPQSLGGDR